MTVSPDLDTDVLIVGSGPVGATFARVLSDRAPGTRILLIDAGPQLTPRPGQHVKTITDPTEREQAQLRSQGPTQYRYGVPTPEQRAEADRGPQASNPSLTGRPGTHLLGGGPDMPAAAMSTNVGGMGAHWTCACPEPGNTERIGFIPEEEWRGAFQAAQGLLGVTQQGYPVTDAGQAIQQVLSTVFGGRLPHNRGVQPMPLAVQVTHGERRWAGADVILGPLAEPDAPATFTLRPETLCRRLLDDGAGTVTGALLEDLRTGEPLMVRSRVTVIAADALRTPQLLWASGIRPRALGHYLNDQPQVIGAAQLDPALLPPPGQQQGPAGGVYWVPFHAPTHPYHGQVMELEASPIPIAVEEGQPPATVVGLGWFCAKDVRFEDHVAFSPEETDHLGLPRMTVHHTLTEADQAAVSGAIREVQVAIDALGKPLGGAAPRLIPSGSSLHYQGTVRMGEHDDGTSVCDSSSRVWTHQNLFVGGNGVIPTATASNPTITSVALAIRACDQILQLLTSAHHEVVPA